MPLTLPTSGGLCSPRKLQVTIGYARSRPVGLLPMSTVRQQRLSVGDRDVMFNTASKDLLSPPRHTLPCLSYLRHHGNL